MTRSQGFPECLSWPIVSLVTSAKARIHFVSPFWMTPFMGIPAHRGSDKSYLSGKLHDRQEVASSYRKFCTYQESIWWYFLKCLKASQNTSKTDASHFSLEKEAKQSLLLQERKLCVHCEGPLQNRDWYKLTSLCDEVNLTESSIPPHTRQS